MAPGATRDSALSSEKDNITFITSNRGRKKLVLDGYIFHNHSTIKQSTYFRCAQKSKGCYASVVLYNFNPEDATFENFSIPNREHLNHLRNPDKIQRKEKKSKQQAVKTLSKEKERTVLLDCKSDVFKKSKHVCLFCFSKLSPGYWDVASVESVTPFGENLVIKLDDTMKNSQAFDLLCSLLNVKWRRTHETHIFDKSHCLPLCFKCQSLYQDLFQLNVQIRQLESLMNQEVQVIRDIIERTEKAGKLKKFEVERTQLALLGLDMFRKKVVDPLFNKYDVPAATIEGEAPPKKKRKRPTISPAAVTKGENEVKPDFSCAGPPQTTLSASTPDLNQIVKQEVNPELFPSHEDTAELPWMETNDDGATIHTNSIPSSNASNSAIGSAMDAEDSLGIGDLDDFGADVNSEFETEEQEPTFPNLRLRRRQPLTKNVSDDEYVPLEGDDGHKSNENSDEEEDSDVNEDDLDDEDNDSDSDFEVRKPSRKLKSSNARVKFSTLRTKGLRFRRKYYASRNAYNYYSQRENECHICSVKVIGHKAFTDHYRDQHPDEKRYSCKFCKKHYRRIRDVEIHQRKHTGEAPFKCTECDRGFRSDQMLNSHKLNHHTDRDRTKKPLQCPECDREFPSTNILNNHLAAVHGKPLEKQLYKRSGKPVKTMSCHICDFKVIGHGPFWQHYADVHPDEKKFSCKFCKRHFPYIRECINHQRRHTGEKPFKCPECDRMFASDKAVYHHRINQHTDTERPLNYCCTKCGKGYRNKAALDIHMSSHEETLVVCKTCGRCLRNPENFRRHNAIFHKGEAECTQIVTDPTPENLQALGVKPEIQAKHKCHVCWKRFHGRVFLRKHFAEEHPDRDILECSCGRKFSTYKHVVNHAIRHSKVKLFQCDQCPHSAVSSTELRQHVISHIPVEERKKENVCDVCGLGVATAYSLEQHKKRHEGNQSRWICDECGKSYSEKRGLHHHQKTEHKKILPYKCPYEGCGKMFPLKSVLKKHSPVHMEVKPFTCDICGKGFPYKTTLSRHLREVHNAKGKEGQTPRKKKSKKFSAKDEDSTEVEMKSTVEDNHQSNEAAEENPMNYADHHDNPSHYSVGAILSNAMRGGEGQSHEMEMKPDYGHHHMDSPETGGY